MISAKSPFKCSNNLKTIYLCKHTNSVYRMKNTRESVPINFPTRYAFWLFTIHKTGIYGFIGHGWLKNKKLYHRLQLTEYKMGFSKNGNGSFCVSSIFIYTYTFLRMNLLYLNMKPKFYYIREKNYLFDICASLSQISPRNECFTTDYWLSNSFELSVSLDIE